MPEPFECPACGSRRPPRPGKNRCIDCGAAVAADRPRRARPHGTGGAGVILIVGLLVGGGVLAFIVLAVLAIVLLKPGRGAAVSSGSTAVGGSMGGGEIASPVGKASGGRYVPRVSEKKLIALMERMRQERGENAEFEVTEQQVYELMGAPTSREAPVTVQRNGMTITTYEARWKAVEGETTFETVIVFMNGRFGGGIIGGEFTAPKPDRPARGEFPGNAGAGSTVPVQLSRDAGKLIIGWWDAEIPGTYQPNRRKVHKLRIEFDEGGACRSTEYDERGLSIATTQGKWRVERTEGNRLYLQLDLRIALTNEAIAIGNPVLLTFKNDSEWDVRGLLGGNTPLTFRKR